MFQPFVVVFIPATDVLDGTGSGVIGGMGGYDSVWRTICVQRMVRTFCSADGTTSVMISCDAV